MREIKFRAWANDEKRIVLWEALMTHSLLQLSTDKRLTLMQYTGLKDKNGVEIYEGDLVKSNKGVIFRIIWSQSYARFTGITPNIYTDKPYVGDMIYKSMRWVTEKCIVIDNVYANQELLNE